jgi:serine/threonine protein kinase
MITSGDFTGSKFTLKKVIGRGGSSKVFLAADEDERLIAIKVLRKDKKFNVDTATLMLQREHDLLQLLAEHPNIINSQEICLNGVLNFGGEIETVMYNTLEFAPNGALSTYVRHSGPIEEEL